MLTHKAWPRSGTKGLPQLGGVRPWREGAEENSGLIDKLGEGISAIFSAEDKIEGEVIAKEASAWCGM